MWLRHVQSIATLAPVASSVRSLSRTARVLTQDCRTGPSETLGRVILSGLEDKIFLKGLVFYAKHGYHRAEKELGQKFVIDATLYADLSAACK
jgi:hypothetical protein